ncbi:MAG: hypothetical protein RLZZ505_2426 [Verrucomicrobiota bacterium]|jgi:hypothetical protein
MSDEVAEGCKCHVSDEIGLLLKKPPGIHVFFKGAYLQSPVILKNGAVMVPFREIGMLLEAYRLGQHLKLLGHGVSKENIEDFALTAKEAEPVVVVAIPFDCKDILLATKEIETLVSHYKAVLSWASSSPAIEFGRIYYDPGDRKISMLLKWQMRERWIRCGEDNTSINFANQVMAVLEKCQKDRKFSFALSLYNYAQNESDPVFRIAKIYMCLESLATMNKTGLQTRDAIRKATGLVSGKMTEIQANGKKYQCDLLFGASEIRNHLFHGNPFDRDAFTKAARDDTFDAIENEPEEFARKLSSYCENLVRSIVGTLRLINFSHSTTNSILNDHSS